MRGRSYKNSTAEKMAWLLWPRRLRYRLLSVNLMKCLCLSILIFLSTAVAEVSAQRLQPVFPSLLAPKRLSQDVRVLSSDEYEGRAPATDGEERTVSYIISEMRQAGLQPGGDLHNGRRDWIQTVSLLRSENIGNPAAIISSGGVDWILNQGDEVVLRAALNGADSVSIDSAPLVFVGYGVNAPERDWDDFKGVDLHGKIALVLINDPDFETGTGDFGGSEMTYYGRWPYKFEEIARRGAEGVLIIHETVPASYGWELVRNTDTQPLFDIVRADPTASHCSLEGWIHHDTVVSLFQAAGLDFETLKQQAQTREFQPVELANTWFSTDYQVNVSKISSKNVIGRIEGRLYPEESLIYVAHWDHLGVGADDAQGDHVFNGALDNASGVASLLELGRQFSKGRSPQRSIVFLAVTAEEKLMLGSEYYVNNPIYKLSKTVGVINMDILSPNGLARNFTSAGNPKVELLDDLVAMAAHWGVSFTPDSDLAAGRFFRSDQFSFAKQGVPALWFQSGNDLYGGGIAAGDAQLADYNTNRYHQRSDEWSPSWSFIGISRDLLILQEFGLELANSRRWPNWSSETEFREVRDETAGERN